MVGGENKCHLPRSGPNSETSLSEIKTVIARGLIKAVKSIYRAGWK